MVPKGQRDPLDFICDKLPQKCKGCQKSKNARSFAKGRRHLHKEINIFEQVRERRLFKSALKLLLSRHDRKAMKRES